MEHLALATEQGVTLTDTATGREAFALTMHSNGNDYGTSSRRRQRAGDILGKTAPFQNAARGTTATRTGSPSRSVPTESWGRLSDFLTTQLGTGGVVDAEHTSATKELTTLSNQITAANDQLTQRQQTLQAQFTAMETALAQINAQGSSLLAGLGITSNSSSKSSG